jgi:hypothetical protein
MTYKLIMDNYESRFVRDVNQALNEGWTAVGAAQVNTYPISAVPTGANGSFRFEKEQVFVQTLVKD